jgi:hypothetical protein
MGEVLFDCCFVVTNINIVFEIFVCLGWNFSIITTFDHFFASNIRINASRVDKVGGDEWV